MVLVDIFRLRISFLIFLLATVGISLHGQNIEKMIAKEIHRLWDNTGEIAEVQIAPDVSSSYEELNEGDELYSIFNQGDSLCIGYIFVTSAMGRYDTFDYFIIYNVKLEVQAVRVAEYRSAHGSAMCNKRWLKQFVGYNGEVLVYGKDIQAVSGATISAGSIVDDIQRCSVAMNILKEDQVF